MADKLDVNTGGTAAGKKIWDMHQADEQKHVNNHKEGFCWNCEIYTCNISRQRMGFMHVLW